MNVNKKYYTSHLKNVLKTKLEFYDEDSFYVEMTDADNKQVCKVRLGLSIIPMDQAKSNKVGEGRTEPNQSPFLPPPVGRLSLSLNPFKMFNQLVGRELRIKIYIGCCLALCCLLCIMLIPLVAGNLLTELILSIF
mmetsp:Transcript_3593/g.2626  ORF Transcript_3593/g.2626 Transcript_3593/m.2626 type:complete len:136 (+) Transcript_3593:2509-2916(+)